MAKLKQKQFGKLPPQYNFALNPFPDLRFSKCLRCERKTGQRKAPLFIHIEPMNLIVLNYTCRYCAQCDLLIAHKHEIEHLLAELFRQYNPSIIGNDYLIIGTVEKKTWSEGLTQPKSMREALEHLHGFKSYSGVQSTMSGWFHEDTEPPLRTPPSSTEWVKKKN